METETKATRWALLMSVGLILTPAWASAKGDTEAPSGSTLLVLAYLVLWTILFLYLFFLARRQRALRRQLEKLEAEIQKLEDGDSDTA